MFLQVLENKSKVEITNRLLFFLQDKDEGGSGSVQVFGYVVGPIVNARLAAFTAAQIGRTLPGTDGLRHQASTKAKQRKQ